ncbi:hypothetical protein HZA42_05275 [Candidatus Peregrinibacteria bacterium]|nr:hypothetical protein [Candidatus Peregrinibacteria bacterium]
MTPPKYIRIILIAGSALILLLAFNTLFAVEIFPRWGNGKKTSPEKSIGNVSQTSSINWEQKLFPDSGTELPVTWDDLGKQLVENGVIDQDKLEKIYANRGGLNEEAKALLEEDQNGKIVITKANAGFILNLFWALGLSNKNAILDSGPMRDPQYGDAGNFASTGGWNVSKGDAMKHYSKHAFMKLTDEQQSLVEKISRTIYRPCCDNSTYFPDCNHGMAMLGFLELMASQGADEETMYRAAAQINSYWFPSTYLTIAKYLEKNGASWDTTDPRIVLSANFSSSSGYRNILSQVEPVQSTGGGACGV